MFENKLKMSDLGYIIVNDKMETNIPACLRLGAADPHFRQVITSAGMDAAAIQATRFRRNGSS